MRRREFIGLIGATALSIPRSGYAQTKAVLPVIGLLSPLKSDTAAAKDRVAALRKGLQEEGFVEGRNYSLAMRFSEGDSSRMPQLARELGALDPRVIVVAGAGGGIDAVRRTFPEIPLFFTALAADPIALGLVRSYAHPGGMITGNVMNAVGADATMTQKRIGLFKQLVPDLTRLGVTASNGAITALNDKDALLKVAGEFGFELLHYDFETLDDLEGAFAAALRDDVSAFYIAPEPLLFANMSRVVTIPRRLISPASVHSRNGDAPGF